MVLSGRPLTGALLLLAMWLGLLTAAFLRLLLHPAGTRPRIRYRLSTAGVGFAAVAVASVLLLHLSWLSPSLSQNLGPRMVWVLSLFIFFPSVAGLLLSVEGSGRTRFLGVGSCVFTALYWFALSIGAAISMAGPLARHPTRYLIPAGYVGWVEVNYGEGGAPALPFHGGRFICKIPESGVAATASPIEDGWAADEYIYYSEGGLMRVLTSTGWGSGGMIWGEMAER